ncbi:MAG: hypothetical protein ACXVBE_10740 [Bdellovibrionota bacterium]
MHKRLTAFLISLCLLASSPAFADAECGPERYATDVLDFAETGVSISKELAVADIKTFCRATTANQAQKDWTLRLGKAVRSDADVKNAEEKEAWMRAYHPDAQIRLDAFFKHPQLAVYSLNSFSAAESYLQNPTPLPQGTYYKDVLALESDSKQMDKLGWFGKKDVMEFAACNELIFSMECPGALDKVIQMSMPNNQNFTQVHLYKEILFDKKYDEGLKLAALKVLARTKSGKAAGANLFDDIRDSFLAAGAKEDAAIEMTWKTMGLLATGGPNTGARAFAVSADNDVMPKKVAIALLAVLPPVLDSESFSTGHPYSYPKSISSTCDSGKPYHFWLPAYLGWELARTGTGARAAAAAAFLGMKGYQMMSDTETRDPTKPMKEDFLGPYSNSIRMDLAIASAGAIFGASAGKGATGSKLDIDEGVRRIVRDSEPVEKLGDIEADALLTSPIKFGYRWSKLMAPNSAFSIYKSRLP